MGQTRHLPAGQWFINFLVALGYPGGSGGHCCGAACAAVTGEQTDEGQAFNKRLELMYDLYVQAIVHVMPKLAASAQWKREAINFISQQFATTIKQLVEALPAAERLDLLAWCDSTFGYQNTILLPIKEVQPLQNRLPFFDNVELTEQDKHITSMGYVSGTYTETELCQLLQSFKNGIKKNKVSTPVSFLLRNVNHVIEFTYYPSKKIWHYYDPNYPPIKIILDVTTMASHIHDLAKGGKMMANTIQIFAHDQKEMIEQAINQLKQDKDYKKIHDINDKARHQFDSIGGSWLYTAIAAGDYDTVQELIDCVDIEKQSLKDAAYKGCTPLLIALYFDHQVGNEKIINLILEKYPKDFLNIPSHNERTPLLKAIERNDLDLVKHLVALGANINFLDVLSLAIEHGYVDVAQYLIEQGAKTNFSDSFLKAARNGHLEMLKFLVTICPPGINLLSVADSFKQTALIGAASNGHYSVVKWLHEQGASLDSVSQFKTPLDWAILKNHAHIAEYLLLQRAPIKNVNHLFLEAAKRGALDTMKLMLDKYPNAQLLTVADSFKQTALLWAASKGHYLVVKWLHEQGADLNCASQFNDKNYCNGYTSLDWAIENNHADIADYLLQHHTNSKDIKHICMRAIQKGDINIIKFLGNRHPACGMSAYMNSVNKMHELQETIAIAFSRAKGMNHNAMMKFLLENYSALINANTANLSSCRKIDIINFYLKNSPPINFHQVSLSLLLTIDEYLDERSKKAEYTTSYIFDFGTSKNEKLAAGNALFVAILDPSQADKLVKYKNFFRTGALQQGKLGRLYEQVCEKGILLIHTQNADKINPKQTQRNLTVSLRNF